MKRWEGEKELEKLKRVSGCQRGQSGGLCRALRRQPTLPEGRHGCGLLLLMVGGRGLGEG